MPTECPNCEKLFSSPQCPSCGFSLRQLAPPVRCPVDGSPLVSGGAFKGFCERGGGFPFTMSCPFACPMCGQRLDWSGGCTACHGAQGGGREAWTFPGDGYYTHHVDGTPIGDGMHYVKQQGPRPAVSQRQNAKGMAAVRAALKGILSPAPERASSGGQAT